MGNINNIHINSKNSNKGNKQYNNMVEILKEFRIKFNNTNNKEKLEHGEDVNVN